MISLFETLIGNLIPVASVAFFGWSAFTLLILYWLENVVIGVFNLAKIIICGLTKDWGDKISVAFLAPFFAVHYGMFCYVHGLFIVLLFGGGAGHGGSAGSVNSPMLIFSRLMSDRTLLWNAVIVVVVQLYLFLRYWVATKSWRSTDARTQMFAPYGRIIVVHFTVLLGAFGLALFGRQLIAVLLLALLKTGLETGVLQFNWANRPSGHLLKLPELRSRSDN